MVKRKTYTVSFHNGGRKEDAKDTKGTVKSTKLQANREHNIRDEEYCKTQEHIGFKNKTEEEHREWEKTHVILDEKPEDAYERIFGEAIKKYDAKQKRSDRKIGSGKKYYEKIKNSKNKVPVYEYIITLGNKDNLPDKPEEVRLIYIEALEEFKARNPNLEVIGAYYHDDETRDDGKGGRVQGAPHLHVDYIPVSRNRWQNFIDEQTKKESLLDKLTGKEVKKKTRINGLDVENSLTEALAAQGFISKELDVSVIEKKFGIHIAEKHYKDPERQAQYEEFMSNRVDEKGRQIKTRLLTAQMQWIKHERDCLIRLFEKHGYSIKNPGEHRPHLETQDYIESRDKNIEERNLDLYNELSTRLDYIDEEEKELSEKEKLLNEKEEALKQKETEQAQKEKEQTEKDAVLESKVKIVEDAESQLEEARQINAETEAYRNDIGQIRNDLYQEIKSSVDKDYKAKYQELYEVQQYQDLKTKELNNQELQQTKKAEELAEREKSVSNLEAEKKVVEEKTKSLKNEKEAFENEKKEKAKKLAELNENLSAREEKVKIDTEANKEKESALNIREEELNTAIKNFNEEYTSAENFFKEQQQNFDENQNSLVEYRKEYKEKSAKINEWEEASKVIESGIIEGEDKSIDTWVREQFDNCFKKKTFTVNDLFQKIKTGIKGAIAKVKKLYDKKIKKYEEQLNGYNFTDKNGKSVHSFGSAEIQTMFITEADSKTFRQIADDMDAEGVTNYAELHQRKPKYLERHFEYAREITRENSINRT